MIRLYCEKCGSELPLHEIIIICKPCFNKMVNAKHLSLIKEIDYYKKRCRGLITDRDKLRTKLYYGKAKK